MKSCLSVAITRTGQCHISHNPTKPKFMPRLYHTRSKTHLLCGLGRGGGMVSHDHSRWSNHRHSVWLSGALPIDVLGKRGTGYSIHRPLTFSCGEGDGRIDSVGMLEGTRRQT